MTERLIIEGLKNGNEKAFDNMYDKYKNIVFFVIFDIVKNKTDSEDLLIETFEDAYININSFKGDSLKSWIIRIGKNKAINYYKKQKNIEYISEEDLYNYSQNDSKLNELCDDLKKVLSYEEFTVLVLSALYDMKHREIGEYLNKPVGTISWLYQEARKKAQKFLKGE